MMYQNELDFAIETAREAGKVLMKHFGKFEPVGIREDDEWSADATQADIEVDNFIKQKISKKFPEHSIYGEESEKEGTSDFIWRVDAPDGTNNFKRGNPEFSILISLENQENIFTAVIYKPFFDEVFFACLGEGAWHRKEGKDARLHVSKETLLREAIVSFNSAMFSPKHIQQGSKILANIVKYSPQIRFRINENTGLDLANVAHGFYTIHIGFDAKPWDYTAGTLLIREAGGKVTDFDGNDIFPSKDESNMIASNGLLHEKLLELVREAL